MDKKLASLLVLIIALAFFVRLYEIDKQSMVKDEYQHFLSAQLSCSNPLFPVSMYEKPVWFYDQPLLGQYIYELGCLVPDIGFSRLLSVIFGVGSVFLLFLVGKDLFDEKTGLLAAFLYAFSIPVIAYSRLAMLDSFVAFFILLSAHFFLAKKDGLSWFSAGVAFGTKYSAAVLLPVFLYKYFLDKKLRLKPIIKNLLMFFAGFLATNFAGLLMWDYLSPNKDMMIRVPIILKTFIYQAYAQDVFGLTGYVSNVVYYLSVLYYQIGLLPLALFAASAYLIWKRKDRNGYLLVFWVVAAFLFATKISAATRYMLPLLPPFFLVVSYGILRFSKKREVALVLVGLLAVSMLYSIASIQPYYLLFGYENGFGGTGATLYGQYTKESMDFINTNTSQGSVVYWETLSWHPVAFKPSKYNLVLLRNTTSEVGAADYFLVDLQYKLSHPGDEVVRHIESDCTLVKEFGAKGVTLVWMYEKP
jgi:4-amino-4-deoxy-L-arabinose transferase-like glycosyltransferase